MTNIWGNKTWMFYLLHNYLWNSNLQNISCHCCHRKDMDLWGQVQRRPQKWSEGWSTSPTRTGLNSWGCSAWRREGSRETLQQPSSTWRGLQESWRGTFYKGM